MKRSTEPIPMRNRSQQLHMDASLDETLYAIAADLVEWWDACDIFESLLLLLSQLMFYFEKVNQQARI